MVTVVGDRSIYDRSVEIYDEADDGFSITYIRGSPNADIVITIAGPCGKMKVRNVFETC